MKDDEILAFNNWLARCGAQVLAPTNPWEVARFKANGGTHVIYTNKHKHIKAAGFAKKALDGFRNGRRVDMGIVKTPREAYGKYKPALLIRDGRCCFYCFQDMPNDDMTVEHLIALDKGGPNTMENMVLAHGQCNKNADNLPVIRKIQIRESNREKLKLVA
jgi:hypothetical protein